MTPNLYRGEFKLFNDSCDDSVFINYFIKSNVITFS